MKISVIVTGRSYHTTEGLPDEIELAGESTVDDAIAALCGQLSEGARLPPSCLVAVSGQHLGTLDNHQRRVLREGDELTLIAPVAGG